MASAAGKVEVARDALAQAAVLAPHSDLVAGSTAELEITHGDHRRGLELEAKLVARVRARDEKDEVERARYQRLALAHARHLLDFGRTHEALAVVRPIVDELMADEGARASLPRALYPYIVFFGPADEHEAALELLDRVEPGAAEQNQYWLLLAHTNLAISADDREREAELRAAVAALLEREPKLREQTHVLVEMGFLNYEQRWDEAVALWQSNQDTRNAYGQLDLCSRLCSRSSATTSSSSSFTDS